MRSFNFVSCLVFTLLAALFASPAHTLTLATLPSGHRLEVNAYGPKQFVRLRVYPPGADANTYEVRDVITAKEVPSESIVHSCSNEGCEVTVGLESLTLTFSAEGVVELSYKHAGVELTKGTLQYDTEKHAIAAMSFPLARRLYGIPEHAVDLSLKHQTTYRLMNLDVYMYKLDDPGGIYGSIPFLMAHSSERTSGMLWLNSADTNVEINMDNRMAKWNSEAGMIDAVFFPGPTPTDVQEQHAMLTGPVFMPPLFSLGYHQCRWNYRSSVDCLDVDDNFDKNNLPYDVLWLDIEHTDGKKYFTWDLHNFPNPKELIEKISAKGRRMVTVKDPHLKRENGFNIFEEARDKNFFVKTSSGSDFEGHCWPGTSSWVDFYNKNAREWYATLFKYDRYKESTKDLYTWIDMNEPSVFNAHEVTMDKNAVHNSADGKQVTHRELHNMYGFYNAMAVFDGHMLRNSEPPFEPTRPFILTRSFFAGSQRYAAMWTGDNKAEWEHLQKSIPMLLALSISNFPFAGADVGGFFNNPEIELLVRWYQAAAFTPFFRGHSHLETKRREPYLHGEENTKLFRYALYVRYLLMPYYYTTFYLAHKGVSTIIRPLFYEFPKQEKFLDEQNAYMFGPSLLVRPIVEKGATSVTVPLPSGEKWYQFPTGELRNPNGEEEVTMPVDMNTIPAFLRGGSVLPTKPRLRRSTSGQMNDPLSIYVALNAQGNAFGKVYDDDGESYRFEKGGYVLKELSFSDNKLVCRNAPRDSNEDQSSSYNSLSTIERIVFLGLKSKPKAAFAHYNAKPFDPSLAGGVTEVNKKIELTVEGNEAMMWLRKPALLLDADWTVELTYA